ncbi:MAG TPA: hypothetical protein DCQ94_06170 [Nitrospira sp.]|nr:hypothetical protein [Nitrospira sp.]
MICDLLLGNIRPLYVLEQGARCRRKPPIMGVATAVDLSFWATALDCLECFACSQWHGSS